MDVSLFAIVFCAFLRLGVSRKDFLLFETLEDSCVLFIIGCSNNEKTTECSTFLECLDGTYWTNNNNQSVSK